VITAAVAANVPAREAAIKVVTEIQRADFDGDRAALKRLPEELAPYLDDERLSAQVRYWRGFALWRRAINGFNDAVDPKELQEDLQLAVEEFKQAQAKDAGFVDAKIGELSCTGLLAFSVGQKDTQRMRELIARTIQLRKEAETAAPDNPRFLWVSGPMLWNIPVERGGGQPKAIEAYEKGLEVIRKNKAKVGDPLEPRWGEPELLMSMAWSELNCKEPDLDAAEKYAHAALQSVPYWHYVRDILMVQIREAKGKVGGLR
jgi:hypothetical protein